MSHINNTKQITMFQTTPQTHSIIKTEVLVILDGFLKLQLIIINKILVIVSGITKNKNHLRHRWSLSQWCHRQISELLMLTFYSLVVQSLLYSYVFYDFVYQVKVAIDVSLRNLFLFFINLSYKAVGLIYLLHFFFFIYHFGTFGLYLKAQNKQKKFELSFIAQDLQYHYEIEIL